jgi:hypothetical protein
MLERSRRNQDRQVDSLLSMYGTTNVAADTPAPATAQSPSARERWWESHTTPEHEIDYWLAHAQDDSSHVTATAAQVRVIRPRGGPATLTDLPSSPASGPALPCRRDAVSLIKWNGMLDSVLQTNKERKAAEACAVPPQPAHPSAPLRLVHSASTEVHHTHESTTDQRGDELPSFDVAVNASSSPHSDSTVAASASSQMSLAAAFSHHSPALRAFNPSAGLRTHSHPVSSASQAMPAWPRTHSDIVHPAASWSHFPPESLCVVPADGSSRTSSINSPRGSIPEGSAGMLRPVCINCPSARRRFRKRSTVHRFSDRWPNCLAQAVRPIVVITLVRARVRESCSSHPGARSWHWWTLVIELVFVTRFATSQSDGLADRGDHSTRP